MLPVAPRELYAAGALNADEFLIGANSEDGITPYYEYVSPIPQNVAKYASAMATHWGDYAAAVEAQYPASGSYDGSTGPARAFVHADGEYVCNCAIATASSSWAALLLDAGATVYHYQVCASRETACRRRRSVRVPPVATAQRRVKSERTATTSPRSDCVCLPSHRRVTNEPPRPRRPPPVRARAARGRRVGAHVRRLDRRLRLEQASRCSAF